MAELRARLRQATAPLHARIDEAYAGFAFDQHDGYRRFLRAHGRALGALEVALERAGVHTLLDDWSLRVRRHALRQDLADLGEPPPAELIAPALSDSGSCWGAAYVLEGSRLGARVLAQRLRQADPRAPTRYLEHGDVARLWPVFLKRFEGRASAGDWPAMLAAAEASFALFADAAAVEHQPANR